MRQLGRSTLRPRHCVLALLRTIAAAGAHHSVNKHHLRALYFGQILKSLFPGNYRLPVLKAAPHVIPLRHATTRA